MFQRKEILNKYLHMNVITKVIWVLLNFKYFVYSSILVTQNKMKLRIYLKMCNF